MKPSSANLYDQLQIQRRQDARHTALVTDSGSGYRYPDLDRESAKIARFLTGLGVRPGDRVSVQVHKSPQALLLFLACLRAGFVFHPLNTGYREHELAGFFADARPVAIICDQKALVRVTRLARVNAIRLVLTLNLDGSGTLAQGAQEADADFGIAHREPDDLAALLYSSGTTGKPKGIMLSHNNLLSNIRALIACWGFSEHDVLLHALPIFHVHGLFVACGSALLSGAGMRWLPYFDVASVLRVLPQCTVMMGVPTYYTRLLAAPDFTREAVAGMRLFISGSAPLPEDTFREFEVRTGHRILERYGMTETNMITSNPLHGERLPGTVGTPLPGVDVRVVDDSGEICDVGAIGNVQVRGDNVFRGYWRMPEKTVEDFTSDGFFNTGDQGRIDANGYLSLVGRARDMVISGGLNVYPRELERLIDELDGVRESAVIGVPHADLGEAVVAVVVAAPGRALNGNEIIARLRNDIAGFKVPKRIEIVDALPRNAMGKVQKNSLRDRFRDVLQ